MKRKIFIFTVATIIVIVALALSFTAGCVPKASSSSSSSAPSTTDLNSKITTNSTKLATLETTLNNLITKVNTTVGKDWSGDINSQSNRISNLESQLDSLQQRVASLESANSGNSSDSSSDSDETTRWDMDVSTNYTETDVGVGRYISPSRIEEADIYKIRLTLKNYKTTAITDLYVDISFTPKTGDRVFVDEDNTFLDTIISPYYLWDMDFITRGDEDYTRRISFMSEQIDLPAATPATETDPVIPSETLITLEFSLEYE